MILVPAGTSRRPGRRILFIEIWPSTHAAEEQCHRIGLLCAVTMLVWDTGPTTGTGPSGTR